MKTNHLIPLLLFFMLLLTCCAREEADTHPAVNQAAIKGKFSVFYYVSGNTYEQKPGVITASEWKDLDHWSLWAEMMKEGKILPKEWKFSLQNRYSVILTDSLGEAIPDARVSLETLQEDFLDESRTDNTGRCELFTAVAGIKSAYLRLKIVYADQVFYTGNLDAGQGLIKKRLNIRRKVVPRLEVMFVVNPGSTMSHELLYLQAGLTDIWKAVKEKAGPGLDMQLGNAFYKEQNGKYLTRSSTFTSDIAKACTFTQEGAATGADTSPQAINLALEEAIYRQRWSKEALGRIIFLLTDSPPSYLPARAESLLRLTEEAARQGIRIIPLTTTPVDPETEFLLRAMAIRTNGTYVVMSGNGSNSPAQRQDTSALKDHREENLNDLLVRLLVNMTR
jgi:hypothetical protein